NAKRDGSRKGGRDGAWSSLTGGEEPGSKMKRWTVPSVCGTTRLNRAGVAVTAVTLWAACTTTDGAQANEPPRPVHVQGGFQPPADSDLCQSCLSLPTPNTSTRVRPVTSGAGSAAAGRLVSSPAATGGVSPPGPIPPGTTTATGSDTNVTTSLSPDARCA